MELAMHSSGGKKNGGGSEEKRQYRFVRRSPKGIGTGLIVVHPRDRKYAEERGTKELTASSRGWHGRPHRVERHESLLLTIPVPLSIEPTLILVILPSV